MTPEDEVKQEAVHLVVLIHGIRDFGEWEELVKAKLAELPNTVVLPLGYNYYDPIRFLLPGMFQTGPQQIIAGGIRQKREELRNDYQDVKVSVIAHSFGTHVIAGILREAGDITLEYLILCGSVLPRLYDFDKNKGRVENMIVNDVGCRDVWPIFAKICTFGYGAAGTFGFQRSGPQNRYFDHGHGGYFSDRFIDDYWVSIFRDQISQDEVPTSGFRRKHPALIRMLGKLFRGFIPVTLILFLLFISPVVTPVSSASSYIAEAISEIFYGPPINKEESREAIDFEDLDIRRQMSLSVLGSLQEAGKEQSSEFHVRTLLQDGAWAPVVNELLSISELDPTANELDNLEELIDGSHGLTKSFRRLFYEYFFVLACEVTDLTDFRLHVLDNLSIELFELKSRRTLKMIWRCYR